MNKKRIGGFEQHMISAIDIRDMAELNIPQPTASVTDTLKERGDRYGKFIDHARICHDIKRAMWFYEGWTRLEDDQKQALEVIADKIARILNGDPNYIDNWHDIQGYAKLVEDRLANQKSGSR